MLPGATPQAITAIPLDQFTLDGLDPALHKFVDWNGRHGPMFDHPLHRDIHLTLTAAIPAWKPSDDDDEIPAGLTSINQIIAEKTEYGRKCAQFGFWCDYIFNFHRPYRVAALLDVIRNHGASRHWHLVREVWIDSEDNMNAADEWSEIWSHAYDDDGQFRKCFQRRLMRAADRRAYDALPEVVTVYRGCRERHHAWGYSWTLDPDKAEWFARRFQGSKPAFVAKLDVHKSVILALFNDRQESEVVLDVDYLDDPTMIVLDPEMQQAA